MERKASLVEIIKSITPVFFAVLLTYGYVYLSTYYGHFGIDVRNHFSIQDYLSANVDNIYKLVLPFSIAFAFGALPGFLRGKTGDSRKRRWDDILAYVLIAVLLIGGIVKTYITKSPSRYWFFWFATMAIWVELAGWILAKVKKLFIDDHSSLTTMVTVSFIVVFLPITFATLYFNAKMEASKIVEYKKSDKNIEVYFDDGFLDQPAEDARQLIFIGSNSTCIFLYDARTGSTYAIPANKAKGMRITPKKQTPD